MKRTRFSITLSILSTEVLSAAEKREIKDALRDKADRIKLRGYEVTTGVVKVVVPVSRSTDEEGKPEVKKVRKPRVVKAEPETEAPVRKARGKAAPAAVTRKPKSKPAVAKARVPAGKSLRAAKAASEEDDFDLED